MTNKKKKVKDEDAFDGTVVTSIEKFSLPVDEKAYILFIAGSLIGKMFLLEEAETVIGRADDDDVDISISDPRISRKHTRITLMDGEAIIEDMGSTNGTFVNGTRVRRGKLNSNDKIHISSETIFKFAIGDEAERMFQEEMHQMANYDAVTGCLNKHVLLRRLGEEFSYSKRKRWDLSFLMIDIDFFKKVNDTFGHMAGDFVLNGVAKRVQGSIRDEDILARYGGEEFGVILRGIDSEGAMILAERIREAIEKKPFKFEKKIISVTISIGIATLDGDNFESYGAMIEKADEYLYISKENGRNRVTA